MNNALTIRTAFSIVILSILSAFLAGGLVMGIATSFPDSPKKIYTYISFFIGQGFMLVPLGYFLISRQQPILKILRLRKVSRHIIVNTLLFGSGIGPKTKAPVSLAVLTIFSVDLSINK